MKQEKQTLCQMPTENVHDDTILPLITIRCRFLSTMQLMQTN